MPITTTLNRILAKRTKYTSRPDWKKLLAGLEKTQADDEPLPFSLIVRINGIGDALWACRVEPKHAKEWRLYAVWCARQVQHLMTDQRSLDALDVAERHANGEATKEELRDAHYAARAAVPPPDAWNAEWYEERDAEAAAERKAARSAEMKAASDAERKAAAAERKVATAERKAASAEARAAARFAAMAAEGAAERLAGRDAVYAATEYAQRAACSDAVLVAMRDVAWGSMKKRARNAISNAAWDFAATSQTRKFLEIVGD